MQKYSDVRLPLELSHLMRNFPELEMSSNVSDKTNLQELKQLLLEKNHAFWHKLRVATERARAFDELFFLTSLRKKALSTNVAIDTKPSTTIRLAILGGFSLYPLHTLLTHLLETAGVECELFVGEYDNYVSEIIEPDSALYEFRPQIVCILPGPQRYSYQGAITDERAKIQSAASAIATDLLNLCRTVHERTSCEVVLANFMLPSRYDLGDFRLRTLASDWSFRKWINLELGLNAPSFVRICDVEFLAHRHGGLQAEDARGWFQSKQPCAASLQVDIARELSHLIRGMRLASKKVLALDLDNTLWGGVVADDGLDGIEIGDTSPRGEAFKAFQRSILALKKRGVLLAVCSKNDHARAAEPFEKHPEMVLRMDDFVSFKANWEPKSDNLRRMAEELRLGLDSFVFVDDNPAEIDIVRQFAPLVSTIQLNDDPTEYVGQLMDCRYFEPRSITDEDTVRTEQYLAETARESMLASATDMDAYLASLEMVATVNPFLPVDVPRLSQLINKSNQFNLTTRRRTEAEVKQLIGNPEYVCFSVRLQDRFGDHGLICIIIGRLAGSVMQIDTWLMSCRVLKRQVEETVLNQICRLAKERGCATVEGIYLATAKNEMVREHYLKMGFQPRSVTTERGEYVLELDSHKPVTTKISVKENL